MNLESQFVSEGKIRGLSIPLHAACTLLCSPNQSSLSYGVAAPTLYRLLVKDVCVPRREGGRYLLGWLPWFYSKLFLILEILKAQNKIGQCYRFGRLVHWDTGQLQLSSCVALRQYQARVKVMCFFIF